MTKSNIQLHTKQYSTKLTCCQVYKPVLMLIKKGQLIHVNDYRKGHYDAIATEDFDTEKEEFYPIIVAPGNFVEGMSNFWKKGDSIPCRKGHCSIT